MAEKHQNLEDREKIWPSLVAQGALGEGEGSMAPLPVPVARIGPGELLLVPFLGSKEEFPGPGEDNPGHSGAGSKWIWDTTVPCRAGAQPALSG